MSEDFKDQDQFQRFDSDAEILKFFDEGVKSLGDTMIWTRNQEKIIQTYLNHVDHEKKIIRFWCPKGFHGKTFQKTVDPSGVNEFFFNLALPASNLFFKTTFLHGDESSLSFSIPFPVFKLQRRSYLRIKLSNETEIPFRFQDPVFPESKIAKKMIDLSAGGLSFSVLEQEESLFHPGMKLEGIQFSLKDKTICCDGEVRYFHAISQDHQISGIKIGIRFNKLKAEDSQAIARFVFEESRKHLLRYF